MSAEDWFLVIYVTVGLVWAGICVRRGNDTEDTSVIVLGLWSALIWPVSGVLVFGYWLGGKVK